VRSYDPIGVMSIRKVSRMPMRSLRNWVAREIVRHTRVVDLETAAGWQRGMSSPITGTCTRACCERWWPVGARVGRMVGLELPSWRWSTSTSSPRRFRRWRRGLDTKEQLHCIDFEGEIICVSERGGMLIGYLRARGVPWSPTETPWDFGQNLLPNDLERIVRASTSRSNISRSSANQGLRRSSRSVHIAPDGNRWWAL